MTRPGCFLVLDGPSGVGKSTVTGLLAERLTTQGYSVVATKEPSTGPIGMLARGGTHSYQGLSLACLVAADRYHHLDTIIRPALQADQVVVCDRYLPTSLVLQPLDDVPPAFVRRLNAHIDTPDLTIILTGDPQDCVRRAAQRGTYSRFHNGITGEVEGYQAVVEQLKAAGHPAVSYDVRHQQPAAVAEALDALIHQRVPMPAR